MRTILVFTFFSILNFLPHQIFAQVKHFQGSWTKIGTTYVFEFDLYLNHRDNNVVTGHFDWKVVRFDEKSPQSRDYYKPKLGKTAKEFVRGTYNPTTKEYFLKGYKKDDPNWIISTDEYRLKLDEYDDISGKTKSNNTWKGRINGNAVKKETA